MATKTPVSILQEMMAKQGNPPQYDLIYDGSGTHEAHFKYKVYADNVIATGSGRSKKEAKHEAAKNALKCLAQYQITSSVEQTNIEGIEVISPYQDKMQDNAVGSLNDLCVMYEIPMPDYKHIKEEGPPHERIFTHVCTVSKLKETGVGRTKKQAKQLAASYMLTRLKESLGDLVISKDSPDSTAENKPNENFKEAINRYISKVGSPKKKVKLNDYPYLYHKTLQTMPEDVVKEIQELEPLGDTAAAVEDTAVYWENLINALAQKMQLTVLWTTTPSSSGISDPSPIVWLQLSTTPEFVSYGCGKTEELARVNAAVQCMEFLKTMTRKPKTKSTTTSPDNTPLSSKENVECV